jgi:hypothetical protein
MRACLLVSLVMLTAPAAARVKPGIEVLAERHFDLLTGKKVGIIINPTRELQGGGRLNMCRKPYLVFWFATLFGLISIALLSVTFASQDYRGPIIAGVVTGALSIGLLMVGCRGSSRWSKVASVVLAIPIILMLSDTSRRIPYLFRLLPHGYRFVIPDGYRGYFRVAYGAANAPPLSVVDSFRMVRVSPAGEAETSEPLDRRELVDEVIFEKTGKDAPVAHRRVSAGPPGVTYLYVFVGTFDYYRSWFLSHHDGEEVHGSTN